MSTYSTLYKIPNPFNAFLPPFQKYEDPLAAELCFSSLATKKQLLELPHFSYCAGLTSDLLETCTCGSTMGLGSDCRVDGESSLPSSKSSPYTAEQRGDKHSHAAR